MKSTVVASVAAIIAASLLAPKSASAVPIPVYGGLTYDTDNFDGYSSATASTSTPVVASGIGIASSQFVDNGNNANVVGQRVTPSGATVLNSIGVNPQGYSSSAAISINSSGVIAGYANKYDSSGTDLGLRAVKWSAGSATPTELQTLGETATGVGFARAVYITSSGAMTGMSTKYVNGQADSDRPVRWNTSGQAEELSTLGYTTTIGFGTFGQTVARWTNASGYTVGSLATTTAGTRAALWDAAGAGTELLPLTLTGSSTNSAVAINDAGTIIGTSSVATTDSRGRPRTPPRAVKWDLAGNVTALGSVTTLGSVTAAPNFESYANAINASGTIVGSQSLVSTNDNRAVRWDSAGNPTILGILSLSSSDSSNANAYSVNDTGTVAGYASVYADALPSVPHATIWGSDNVAFDLNALIDPNSGWLLNFAYGITNDNWVSGVGTFDPDGAGPLTSYARAFLIQVPSSVIVVPEPTLAAILPTALLALCRKRRA